MGAVVGTADNRGMPSKGPVMEWQMAILSFYLISSYLIVHLIFHLISDSILSCLLDAKSTVHCGTVLQTHVLCVYLILLTDTYCALLCIATQITHVEHSRIPYIRIPQICLIVIACMNT